MTHIVVVGAGQAGQTLTSKLRTLGFDGRITLIGEEPHPPYQRPPLSKDYLLGKMDRERLYLRGGDYYTEQSIELRLGAPVTAIDRDGQTVTVAGETLRWDQLALTTGSVPRRLPASIGGALDGVYTVRTLADIDRMEPEFRPGARLLVVGGGYIGLEAAAVATRKGVRVTLIEMAERILQRVAAPQTADVIRAAHEAEGVIIREGTALASLGGGPRVRTATLADGSELEVDFVIVGVGITPATDLAEAAGLAIENGIRTDSLGRTSDPAIWAAGDCASFPWKGGRIRLESVGNAIDMADTVAANMLGAGMAYDAKPWFWSDQYDLKLQIAGLGTGYDRIVVRPGEAEGAVSHWYYRGDELLAIDAINDARAYMVGKRLIEMGRSPDPRVIADPAENLKTLLRA